MLNKVLMRQILTVLHQEGHWGIQAMCDAVCCGLTWPVAKHHTAVRSPFPLPLWDEGEKQESEACGLS